VIDVSLEQFDRHRRGVPIRGGRASCVDTGGAAPVAVFVHGIATSSYLWRKVIARVDGDRRCIAMDLPLHGQTPARPGQDLSRGGLAGFVDEVCDALGLDTFDPVADDTGGAVSQIFAARHPRRLRTLTLTNCEAHDNVPPPARQSHGGPRVPAPGAFVDRARPARGGAGSRTPVGAYLDRLG
jgi:pimeloyl-ACP methyl ester carboxylesterase